MTLSAAAEAHRSWAWLIAALAAYGLFLFFAPYIRKIRNPSPTRALTGANRVKVQAKVGVNTDDTEPDTGSDELDWWGRIRVIGGVRIRQVKQVLATGSHELPEGEGEDVDLALDDEGEQKKESPERYVARCRDMKVPYVHIVRVLVEHYGLTTDQAKYRIRKVDGDRRDPEAA